MVTTCLDGHASPRLAYAAGSWDDGALFLDDFVLEEGCARASVSVQYETMNRRYVDTPQKRYVDGYYT